MKYLSVDVMLPFFWTKVVSSKTNKIGLRNTNSANPYVYATKPVSVSYEQAVTIRQLIKSNVVISHNGPLER